MRSAVSFRAGVALSTALAAFVVSGCSDDEATNPVIEPPPPLTAFSSTPALIKNVMSGVSAYTLISSDDTLDATPDFIFGGSADGMGLLQNVDGSFTLVVNNEDNFAVSRVRLAADLKPVAGDYLMDSNAGRWRLCSATLATPAEHGFGPVYLTNGESSIESMIHAIDPNGAPNSSRLLPALGKWNSEQSLPLPKTAYPGQTAILIGDDDSGINGGQLAMYFANTVGDLDGGALYVLARTDGNQRERDMVVGATYPVEFKRILNQTTLTGAQIDAQSNTLGSIRFGRTEDIDYRKGVNAGREIYFNVTGQNTTGVNADNSRTKYGRTYRLIMSASNPLSGTLEVILDGDNRTGPAGQFQNPDNITVTENYVYVAEDPNGYGDETHDARIYQYSIATGAVQTVMELDHRRGDPKYNAAGASAFGSWEYGALIDVSTETGRPGTFMVAIQPHTWTGERYRNPDGGTIRPNEAQASQIVILSGLPR